MICVCVCIHTYIYIHTHTYIYIHTHTHTHIYIESNLTIIMSGTCVIWSLPRSNNGTCISKSGWVCWKYELQYELSSGMGPWRVVIKITSNIDDDDYYCCCIIKVSCSPLAWNYFCAIIINSWYSCLLDCTCMTESRYSTLYTITILGLCIIWSLSRQYNNIMCHVRMSSAGVGTPVWIASGIGHW